MVVLSFVPRGRTTKVDCDDRNQLKLKDLARLGEVRAILTSLESEAVRDLLIYEISINTNRLLQFFHFIKLPYALN